MGAPGRPPGLKVVRPTSSAVVTKADWGHLTSGQFRMYLDAEGHVIVPDLIASMIPTLAAMGVTPEELAYAPCMVECPRFLKTRSSVVEVPAEELPSLDLSSLWRLHEAGMLDLEDEGRGTRVVGASLLEVKVEIARRLMRECTICERRCRVDRTAGETGYCGLGMEMAVAAHAPLMNEGPLVGAPTFGVFLAGCALRCRDCYRDDTWLPTKFSLTSPEILAGLLDRAADADARSWQFLGGNPDHSLLAVLKTLSLSCRARAVVWNTALVLTPEAMNLLSGIVDIWIVDLKFGNDDCGLKLGSFPDYTTVLRRNLRALRDQEFVVVRHPLRAGHEGCCTRLIRAWEEVELPGHFKFTQHPVWHRFGKDEKGEC